MGIRHEHEVGDTNRGSRWGSGCRGVPANRNSWCAWPSTRWATLARTRRLVPGADPPALYVWFTLAKGFGAAVLAGAAVAKIARTFAIHAAVILVGLGAAQGVYQIVTIVESHPHWYAFVLPLLLVPGVPLGVLLVRRVFPDPVPVEQPEES